MELYLLVQARGAIRSISLPLGGFGGPISKRCGDQTVLCLAH